jgi:mannosylglycerate hydrolase
MFQNAAHDSICGCSVDEVSSQVLVRYAEAEQIGRELAWRAVRQIAAEVPRGAFAVVNPSPRERTDLVELEVAVPEEWEAVGLELPDGSQLPTQEVSRQDPLLWETTASGAAVPSVLARRLHGRELFGRHLNGFRIEERRVLLEVSDERDPVWLDVQQLIRELTSATAEGEWTLRVVARPKRTVLASVPAPPLGWTAVRPVQARGTVPGTWPDWPVELEPLTRIVRGRDVGDSYNYAPPDDDVLVDTPVEQRLEVVEEGPLRRLAVLHRTYVWDDRQVATRTSFELRAGEPFVRIHIDFDNPCDDQRVRVHMALTERADRSFAEGQFAVVERGLEVEGGYGEVPVPTYPASSFVEAGGVALLLEHVTEYELVGDELALTILRSTGLISRTDNPWREDPAGPSIAIPAAQLRGPRSFSFAYLPNTERIHEHAEQYRHPFMVAPGAGEGALRDHAGPPLEADSSVVLTGLQPGQARIVNESAAARTAVFAGRTLNLQPWEIRNVFALTRKVSA